MLLSFFFAKKKWDCSKAVSQPAGWLAAFFITSIDSRWLRTSICAKKIVWCNSKVVERLLLGWIEITFLFSITFFFQIYLKLCCSKRKEQPLKWGIDLWDEMMRPFWQSRFTSLSKGQKVWFYHFSLQRKSESVQRPWWSLRAVLRPFLTSIDSSWFCLSICAKKILWCISKVVERLLLGWNEIIILFLMTFFPKFVSSYVDLNVRILH